MNWILGLLFVMIVIYLMNNHYKKKRLKNLKQQFIKNWGKPKKDLIFNFHSIGKYFENNKNEKDTYNIISERIKSDLDLDEIFQFIDRTSSKIGQQYLYYKLRTIESIDKLKKFDSLSNIFLKNSDLRIRCQLLLSNLNSVEAYDLEKLINDKPIEKSKILIFVYLLSLISIVSILLIFVNPMFSLALIPVFFINVILHYRNKENINYYINGVNQLDRSLIVSKGLASIEEIRSHHTTDLSFIKKIDAINLKTKFIGFEKKLDNEFAFLFWFIMELIKIQFNIEYIIFYSFIDSITKEIKSIEQMFVFIGEIDCAISTASIKASDVQVCIPKFVDNKHLVFKDISHPLIENCVLNSLSLMNNSMLLTGSNMSGKTTFIRTVAVNTILAQTLNICFAKEYIAAFFKIYTSIRLTDDLLENTSYYLEEVLTIKEFVEASQEKDPCLFVLDEIFKGTNTIERVSGGKAILSYLNKNNHLVLVSTHDIELTDLLEKENYKLYHFREYIEHDELRFDHKLKNGQLKTKNAIEILRLYKYPPSIIEDAKKTEQTYFENN